MNPITFGHKCNQNDVHQNDESACKLHGDFYHLLTAFHYVVALIFEMTICCNMQLTGSTDFLFMILCL